MKPKLLDVQLPNFHVCDLQVRMMQEMFGVHAQLSMRVNDVLTGERSSISSSFHIAEMDRDPRLVRVGIRNALQMLLQHELDEQLFIDGERLTDPHPEARGQPHERRHPLPLSEVRVVHYDVVRARHFIAD